MSTGLEAIADKEYIGRVIIIGQVNGHEVIAYAVTGRSESSRARVLKEDRNVIRTMPIDSETIKKGNPTLLLYDCIRHCGTTFIVSNGAQTSEITRETAEHHINHTYTMPRAVLNDVFRRPIILNGIDVTTYEPDAPNFTPRISGIITPQGAGMSLIEKFGEGVAQHYFDIPLVDGKGFMLATYAGKNVPSGERIPQHQGRPLDIGIAGTTPQEVACALYNALGPKEGTGILSPGQDFRVGVAAVFYNRKTNTMSNHIINRHEVSQ